MLTDLRLAARSLGRARGFAASTALTLALGLGSTTALFTAVRGILLRPLPYPDAGRLVQLWEVGPRGGHSMVTEPNFDDVRHEATALRTVARYQSGRATVTGRDESARVGSAEVSGDFFAVMGGSPTVGRAFVPEERQPGAARVVVVSDAVWRARLGASRDLARAVLRIDGEPHQVIGVMPPGFDFPDGAELWTAAERREPNHSRTAHNWHVVARLRPGATVDAAEAELVALGRALKARYGSDADLAGLGMQPLRDAIVGGARGVLGLLSAGAGVLLLVAVANVATLLLARGEGRRREIGVRFALGASRGRLVRQFLAEVAVVTAVGCVGGMVVASGGARLLAALAPSAVPRLDAVRVDGAVLAFALGLAVAVAAALGVGAGWHATRIDGEEALGGRERSATASGRASRARGMLVGAQVALTALLLVGAGLLARSLAQLAAVDPGFRTDGGVVLRLAFPPSEDSASARRTLALRQALVARLSDIPGVRAAGGADDLPLGGGFYSNGTFVLQAQPDEIRSFDDFARLAKDPSRAGSAAYRVASGGYFAAIGIPLLRGRLFDGRDTPTTSPVAVISASLARAQFGDVDPIGRLIQFGNMDGDLRPLTVVGVVGDVREGGPDARPQPTVYANGWQRPPSSRLSIVLAGAAGAATFDEGAVLAAARRAAHDLDPTLPVTLAKPLRVLYRDALGSRRAGLALAGAFAVSALLLAIAGIYGVVAYLVVQRRRELGVRVALGARAADVRRLVVVRGLRPAAAGLAAGLVAALAGTRLLASQLYEVRPADPLTFVTVAAVLLAVAVLAALGPARRAARVDPAIALRTD